MELGLGLTGEDVWNMDTDANEDELFRLQRELILYKRLCAQLVNGNMYVKDGSDGTCYKLQVPQSVGSSTELHWFETMGATSALVRLSINVAHTVAAVNVESMVFVSCNDTM